MRGQYFKKFLLVLAVCSLLSGLAMTSAQAQAEVPVKGQVTMVDLGAKSCVPCKMMIPILASLEKKYAGKASIVFIDVWQNPEQGKPFGIRVIPTQIFYDKNGKEQFRHEGFFEEEAIEKILNKLLAS